MQEDSNMNNRNLAFCMQFAYELCSSPIALLAEHGIVFFSDYLRVILDSDRF